MKNLKSNRVVAYLQTMQNLNLLPQCYNNLTAINVSSFHFGTENGSPYIHLNDNPPGDPMFNSLWQSMALAQQNGVLSIAMLGGAGGAYTTLFSDYNTFYPMWRDMLRTYKFDGVDLDIEEPVTVSNIQMFISDLRRDFPSNFYISSAPVCSALQTNNDPFSGLNWSLLKSEINWFNVQFYSGFGNLSTPNDYEQIINNGYAPSQILGGSLTNSANGNGYVDIANVSQTLTALNQQYNGEIGGAMGWEYFNANNTNENIDPVGWTQAMYNAVN